MELLSTPRTHLSVCATGDDVHLLWVVAHTPEQGVGQHQLAAPVVPVTTEEEQSDRKQEGALTA